MSERWVRPDPGLTRGRLDGDWPSVDSGSWRTSSSARSLVESFDELVRAELPPDAEIFDAHVHLGTRHRRDARRPRRAARGSSRRTASRARSCSASTSPTGIRASAPPNDRTLASRSASEGRLVPFVRLDLTESPIEEAVRCLDRGAGGIKLHPRAQKFLLDDERLAPVFELAAERRVPILIHGGRGLPPIADALARLMDALRAAADHRARRHRRPRRARAPLLRAGRASSSTPPSGARSTCSTSTGSSRPSRCSTPPTTPTGTQPGSLLASLRTARMAGLDDEQLRAMLGGSARRIAARRGGAPADAPRAARRTSRTRSRSRASTSTSRWRRRSSGCARRTRSASSASP